MDYSSVLNERFFFLLLRTVEYDFDANFQIRIVIYFVIYLCLVGYTMHYALGVV